MRIRFISIISLFVLCLPAKGQEAWKKTAFTAPPVECYASGKVEAASIPPPEEILNHLKSATGKTANIIVTYNSFPDTVKKAFEYAVGIWERLIESPVPIYVNAKWQKMSSNTLASCGPATYYQNFDGATVPSCYYPIAIVERILGEEVTDSSTPDINATFNNTVSWYYGTDGKTPYTKYDFVTTVLHELAHGLGIVGFFYVENQTGGYETPPTIFDKYVYNRLLEQLANPRLFDNPSTSIYTHLTSGILYFKSPLYTNEAQTSLPRLYAPNLWSDGSSVYHLNETTYPYGDENSLMTYAAGMGEAIHNPGPITMNILADLGWKHLWIEHDKLNDIEQVSSPIIVDAAIKSDFALDSASVFLISSADSFASTDTTQMTYRADSLLFTAELPVKIEKGSVSYYISAADIKGRVFTRPSFAPDSTFKLRIGPDTIAPEIVHLPVESLMPTADRFSIEAYAQDNFGIDSVWVEYRFNNGQLQSFGLPHDSLGSYSGSLAIEPGRLNDGDSILYRIAARDKSLNRNIRYLPEDGFYTVNIRTIYDPITKYANDFENNYTDFITSGFSVHEETGFIGKALHSIHPYLSPEKDNFSFNYTAQLRYPIILLPDGLMSYDEVVLVEPGENNTLYSDENFYDYVIVEGSKNNGETWLPLINGYDSRAVASWETEYNSKIVGNNSAVAGKKELYVRRGISLLQNGNFTVNDTILIRFRLYSDPYAHGWGWVIDNLRIQALVPAEEGLALSSGTLSVYPNPSPGLSKLEYTSETGIKNIEVRIFDSFGKLVSCCNIKNPGMRYTQTIDLTAKASGIYLVQVVPEGKRAVSVRVVKN